MDLQKVYEQIISALQGIGAVNIEVDLKPKNEPSDHVKVFVAFDINATP